MSKQEEDAQGQALRFFPLTLTGCLYMSDVTNATDHNAISDVEWRLNGWKMEITKSAVAICALLGRTYTKHEYANGTVRRFSINTLVSISSALKNFVRGLDLNFKRCLSLERSSSLAVSEDGDVMDN